MPAKPTIKKINKLLTKIMNYSVFIVKIIQTPEQIFFEDNTVATEMLVRISPIYETNYSDILQISVWGPLGQDVAQYYKINDYAIIEGYLSLRENIFNDFVLKEEKSIEFSVLKFYPFLLGNFFFNQRGERNELPF